MDKYPFILASRSQRREALLSSLGIRFKVMVSDIDEVQLPYESPVNCVRRLSREKAQNVANQLKYHPAIILAADTIIAAPLGDDPSVEVILSKPLDAVHAKRVLVSLRDTSHKAITGVSLLVTGNNPEQITKIAITQVHMRAYSDQEIDDYIKSGSPFDKAGGYAIQDEDFNPVEMIEGSYTNVVGLPLETVVDLFDIINYPIPKRQ